MTVLIHWCKVKQMDNEKVPNRIRKPDSVNYILLDRNNFKEILNNFTAVLEKNTKKKYDISIRVDGFSDSFKDTDVFIETIYVSEWKKLSSISVSYYPKVYDKNYGLSLSLRFGGYSADGPGIRIEYGDNLDDIVRIAIKQNVDTFMPEFTRDITLTDKRVSFVAVVIAETGIIAWAILSAGPAVLDKFLQNGSIFIAILVLIGIGMWIYILAVYINHKLIPHFEPTGDMNDTRLKRIGKFGGYMILILGGISAMLSIVQAIFK